MSYTLKQKIYKAIKDGYDGLERGRTLYELYVCLYLNSGYGFFYSFTKIDNCYHPYSYP